MDVDFIAVSFVKTADVINNLKSYLTSRCDKVIEIVAKIESHDSVPNAQDIIEASDAVMIARGDLGTALPCPALPRPKSAVQLSTQSRPIVFMACSTCSRTSCSLAPTHITMGCRVLTMLTLCFW